MRLHFGKFVVLNFIINSKVMHAGFALRVIVLDLLYLLYSMIGDFYSVILIPCTDKPRKSSGIEFLSLFPSISIFVDSLVIFCLNNFWLQVLNFYINKFQTLSKGNLKVGHGHLIQKLIPLFLFFEQNPKHSETKL